MSCQSCLDLNPHFNQVQKTCPDHADLRFCPGCKSPVHHAKFNKNQVRCGPCLARGKFGASRECVYDDTKHDAPLEDFGLRMKTCRPCLKSTFCDACRPGFTCPRHAGRRVCVECNTAKPAFAFIGAKRVCKGCELFKREHPTDEPEVVENPDLHRCQGPCQKEKVNTDFDKDLQVCRVCLDLGCEPCILLNRFDSARTKTMTCSECQNEGLSFCKARIHCVDSESFARHGECHACSLALQRLRGSDIAEKDPLFKRQMILDNIASKKVFDRDARRTCNVCNLEKSAQQYEKGRSTCDKCRRQAYKERCQAAERREQQTCRLCKIEKTVDQFHTGCGNVPESRCKSCRRQLVTVRIPTEEVVQRTRGTTKQCITCFEIMETSLENFEIHTNQFRNQCRFCQKLQALKTNARLSQRNILLDLEEELRKLLREPCFFCHRTSIGSTVVLNDVKVEYTLSNVLASCSLCAGFKNRFLPNELIRHASRIAAYGPSVEFQEDVQESPIKKRKSVDKDYQQLDAETRLELWKSDCVYCGTPYPLGIDRKDSEIGYTPENVQSCCLTCNKMKKDLKEVAFVRQCNLIATVHPDQTPAIEEGMIVRHLEHVEYYRPNFTNVSSSLRAEIVLKRLKHTPIHEIFKWLCSKMNRNGQPTTCRMCSLHLPQVDMDLQSHCLSCSQAGPSTDEVLQDVERGVLQDTEDTKQCSKCGQTQFIAQFSGRNLTCRKCVADQRRVIRNNDKGARLEGKIQGLIEQRKCSQCSVILCVADFHSRMICPKCHSRRVNDQKHGR